MMKCPDCKGKGSYSINPCDMCFDEGTIGFVLWIKYTLYKFRCCTINFIKGKGYNW